MRYGFKARAERVAADARDELGLGRLAPLDCNRYVAQAGVTILDFEEVAISAESRHQLLNVDSESWSGMTLRVDTVTAILINPAHSIERQRNTLMHEMSHIILKHVPTRVDIGPEGILLVSEFSENDEDEANWLAGAMLLPREALMSCRMRNMTNAEIASFFGVSTQLSDWRIRMTGIDVQRRRGVGR